MEFGAGDPHTSLVLIDPQRRGDALEGPSVVVPDPVASLRVPAAVPRLPLPSAGLVGGSGLRSDRGRGSAPQPAEERAEQGQRGQQRVRHGQQHAQPPGTGTGTFTDWDGVQRSRRAAGPPPAASAPETHSRPYHSIPVRFGPESRGCTGRFFVFTDGL